jgi:hypothetical protein
MFSDLPNVADRNEFITKTVERFMDNLTAIDNIKNATDKSPNSDPATNAPSEAIQEPVDKISSTAPPTDSSLFEKPPSNNSIAETTTGMTAMSTDSNNTTALYTAGGGAPANDPGADCIATIGSLPPNGLINTKRSVLDKSNNSLEIVLEALKTQNTDRITNSMVPGTCTMFAHTDPIVFVRIISSIRMNYIESNFAILIFALEIEKQKLEKYKRNKLYQIKKNQ